MPTAALISESGATSSSALSSLPSPPPTIRSRSPTVLSSMASPSNTSFLLTSIVVLCRERDVLAALSHVAAAISEYADVAMSCELWQAAAMGNLTLLQRVHAMRTPTNLRSKNAVDLAIEAVVLNGHLRVVQWLHHTLSERNNTTWAIDIAAEYGHLAIIQWLHEAKSTLDRASMAAMDEAAKNRHLGIVQWLHANRTEGCTTQAMDWAAGAGHLPIVQWLHEHRWEGCSSMAIDNTAANGYLSVVV